MLYFDIGFSLIIALVSIFIRKPYAWVLFQHSIFQIFFLFVEIKLAASVNFDGPINLYLEKSYPLAPFVSTLLLATIRFIGLYFPNISDRYINNKTIGPIILLCDVIFFGPLLFWIHPFYFTDYQQCPEYPLTLCDETKPFYLLPIPNETEQLW